MLPHVIYEVLPYTYILVGVLSVAFFDSIVIFIAALLMVFAGVSVIIMRSRYRRALHSTQLRKEEDCGTFIERSGNERRNRRVDSWPVVDCNGEIVRFDRRRRERRRASAM